MGGSFFCEERGGDRSIGEANLRKGAALQWLAHLAPVRGASPFNGSGTAARPRSSSKMDSLAWLRWAGAGRACRRGGKPPGDWQSQCACPRSFRIWSFVYIRIKCRRVLSFPKTLFYSFVALRIKQKFVFIAQNRKSGFWGELRKHVDRRIAKQSQQWACIKWKAPLAPVMEPFLWKR